MTFPNTIIDIAMSIYNNAVPDNNEKKPATNEKKVELIAPVIVDPQEGKDVPFDDDFLITDEGHRTGFRKPDQPDATLAFGLKMTFGDALAEWAKGIIESKESGFKGVIEKPEGGYSEPQKGFLKAHVDEKRLLPASELKKNIKQKTEKA